MSPSRTVIDVLHPTLSVWSILRAPLRAAHATNSSVRPQFFSLAVDAGKSWDEAAGSARFGEREQVAHRRGQLPAESAGPAGCHTASSRVRRRSKGGFWPRPASRLPPAHRKARNSWDVIK